MGGKYRITGDKYPRMRPSRRRGRLVVVVVACGAVLGVAGWGTLQLVDVFTGGGGTASAASAGECAPKKAGPSAPAVVLPQPAQITVNVFNATTRSGLAKTTADELKKRGFKVGQVGNAPAQFDKKVPGAGVLVGVPAASGTSLSVVGVQLPGAERKMDAARKDASVDLIIGNAFKSLAAPADVTKALAALSAPKTATEVTKKGC
ncbi:LytR C-terminal domain-containing protein [Streptomyces sp. NPDC004539]|uniref:LytR C-terminal domain-containing protein n=1 Tax=Streptomyces sp. NPDC004539 TaxID=3154280 RepID=UPI0033A6BD8F